MVGTRALCVYHALSEAKAAYLRSSGIPVLAHIDDAWHGNYCSTFGCSDKVQRLSAVEALHVGMLVSFLCGYFLSNTKCDFKPSYVQRYLGILCDSSTASFRVPEDKPWKLHELVRAILTKGALPAKVLETMSVAIRPAWLWTHFMFVAIAKAKSRIIQLHDPAHLRAELHKLLDLSSTAQEEQWYKSRHHATAVT